MLQDMKGTERSQRELQPFAVWEQWVILCTSKDIATKFPTSLLMLMLAFADPPWKNSIMSF